MSTDLTILNNNTFWTTVEQVYRRHRAIGWQLEARKKKKKKKSSSPEFVEISWRMLFLSSSRVWGFVLCTLFLDFPTNKSHKLLNRKPGGQRSWLTMRPLKLNQKEIWNKLYVLYAMHTFPDMFLSHLCVCVCFFACTGHSAEHELWLWDMQLRGLASTNHPCVVIVYFSSIYFIKHLLLLLLLPATVCALLHLHHFYLLLQRIY
jgi:hypothetical protein